MLYTLLIILLLIEYIYLMVMLFGIEPISYYIGCRLGIYGVEIVELDDYITSDYTVLGYYNIEYHNNIFWESLVCLYDKDTNDENPGYILKRYMRPLVIYHTDFQGYRDVYGNWMYLIGIPKIKKCIEFILQNIEYILFYGC